MPTSPEVRFQDPLSVGRLAAGLLVLGVLIDAVWLIHLLGAMERPEVAIMVPAGVLHFWTRVATFIAFLIWMDRVYGNLPALGETPEHARIWSTLSFFVPPLMLFRPYQIVDETWRRSGLDAARGRAMVLGWWIALLVPIGVTITSIRPGIPFEAGDRWVRFVIIQVLHVAAGLLAVAIVLQISDEQRSSFSRARREAAAEAVRLRREAHLPPRVGSMPAPIEPPAPDSPTRAGASAVLSAGLPLPRATRPVVPPARPAAATASAPAASKSGTGVRRAHALVLPPATWKIILMAFSAISALALLGGGIALAARGTLLIGAIYAVFSLLIAASTLLASRRQAANGHEQRLPALAIAALLLTIFNVIAVAEAVIG